ncbi:hypothetical protein GCM10009634_40470 [Saccharothrix xinjiangensis]
MTYRRVASETPGSPRSARDTVAADTPAARATSDMLVNFHLPAWYEPSQKRVVVWLRERRRRGRRGFSGCAA